MKYFQHLWLLWNDSDLHFVQQKNSTSLAFEKAKSFRKKNILIFLSFIWQIENRNFFIENFRKEWKFFFVFLRILKFFFFLFFFWFFFFFFVFLEFFSCAFLQKFQLNRFELIHNLHFDFKFWRFWLDFFLKLVRFFEFESKVNRFDFSTSSLFENEIA